MSLSELHLIRDIHEVSVDSNTVNYFVIPQKIQIFISHDTGLSYIFFFSTLCLGRSVGSTILSMNAMDLNFLICFTVFILVNTAVKTVELSLFLPSHYF